MEEYALVITEKPDAANRIAIALDANGKPKRTMKNGVPIYVAERDRTVVVVPALGHLYTVTDEAETRGQYPVFSLRWASLYEADRKDKRTRRWLKTITGLAVGADTFIDACDYDLEGSIIGYCILKYACGGRENTAKRMKYSTLTKEELEKSYATLLPHLDFPLIEAGLARHEVDWLYGMNLSRALTQAAKKHSGRYLTLSTGRVQGPTLGFLAARERSISRFVPKPFWKAKARLRIDDTVVEAEHEKNPFATEEAANDAVEACRDKEARITNVKTRKLMLPPPAPFDLGSLQSEAYSFFGYTPLRTSSIAQRLYLDALISYPRTSSQKLPPEIGYRTILKGLAKTRDFANLARELLSMSGLTPVEGKKTDSAHPAIYPTGKLPPKTLSGAERNVWNLVVCRFLAAFGENVVRQTTKAVLNISGERFQFSGTETLEEGWLRFYKPFARLADSSLPSLKEGERVSVENVALEEEHTQPPPRYNPRSVLKRMEDSSIGTKATRAGILQTLYDRKYIQGERIEVTDLGFAVTDVLQKFCPSAVSVEFTRNLEEKMDAVQQGRQTKEEILRDAVENLKTVTASLKENENAIGKELSQAIQKSNLNGREIGACPTCKTGKLVILYSKKTRKRFVGCTNYFKGTCKTAFPLPQKGAVKPSGKTCKACGWFTVNVWLRQKHPWNLCLNPQCVAKTKGKASV
ncbi:MAG: DNA topoisomerase I [Candidatus Bathyarchaeia archaeon]